jgi:integrase
LHYVFEFARQRKLVDTNPVRCLPNRSDFHISTPFSADEVAQWEETALGAVRDQCLEYDEWLAFWLLRWTGLRPSDVIDLRWREVLFDAKIVDRKCQKNKKRVRIPLLEEERLIVALDLERKRRNPKPDDRVLIHQNGNVLTTSNHLWKIMAKLAKMAKVANANPYRFRGTFAVEMLLRTNNPYYVANLLGDTMTIVERHYMPYVRELREHNRLILEAGIGLRGYVTGAAQRKSS